MPYVDQNYQMMYESAAMLHLAVISTPTQYIKTWRFPHWQWDIITIAGTTTTTSIVTEANASSDLLRRIIMRYKDVWKKEDAPVVVYHCDRARLALWSIMGADTCRITT